MYIKCMKIETLLLSIIAPNATVVVYGILFGSIHPAGYITPNKIPLTTIVVYL